MAFTSPGSFQASYPSACRRHGRVVSSSSISCSSGPERSATRRHHHDGSQGEHSPGHTREFAWNQLAQNQQPPKKLTFAAYGNTGKYTGELQPPGDIFELPDDGGRRSIGSHQPVRTSQGVDSSSIPLDQSSRRTTLFVGHSNPAQIGSTQAQAVTHDPGRQADAHSTVKMHRPIERDDYLLVRGANPRTGLVTPGAHSANSSVDQGRWRQKGDQWISSDLDQTLPMSGYPQATPPEPYHHRLRTPPRLSAGHGDGSFPGVQRPSPRHGRLQTAVAGTPPQNRTVTLDLRQHTSGMELPTETARAIPLHNESNDESTVRRKPVGSPPGRTSADHDSQRLERTPDSSETVLKKPRFKTELRSSSAPDPHRLRIVSPYDVSKALPTLPANAAFPAMDSNAVNAGEESFLEPRIPSTASNVPSSKTSSISGHPMTEKELPCLPMNSGPSLLRQELTPPPASGRESSGKTSDSPTWRTVTPQGPRQDDPARLYGRTARSTHPPATTRPNVPLGERMMSIPVYDNPPKHPSPSTRMTGPRAEGPRPMPGPAMMPPNRLQGEFNISPSTTTIFTNTNTNTSMNRPGVPRPLRLGPRPLIPEGPIMDRGRHGSGPRPPPPQSYSIGMNTDMNTNVDPMVSIPLPRIRPRAMTRPPMPIRAEAMYGLPKLAPHHNRANTTGIEYPPTWPDGRLQPTARLDPRGSELDLVPPPLRPRQPSHDLARPKEVPTKSELTMEGLGLMRKCSRCHHGFVDAKLRGTDSVTPTSDPQREGVEAAEGSKVLHPAGSPLPGVPEDIGENDVVQSKTSSPAPKADVVVDERDHSICCPDCCKDEDCHEGCLGHPSPTPASSPTKSIWSEAQTSSSASDVDDWDNTDDTEGSEKGRSSPFAFVKAALKRSRKKKSQSSLGINASPFELSAHPRTPVTGSREDSARNANDALSAALSATGSPNPMISGRRTRQRQRSSSVPSIGVGVPGSKSDGSRLRVPTPAGLAIACSGAPKSQSRSVSGTSVATFELQVPGFGSLGGSAIGDMVLVPFEASKMWIRNHPQAMTLGWDVLERGWQMGRTMTATGWRIWAVVFVYSKTGKLKLKLAKGETAGGFVIDCARSLVYLMIFAAVGVFVMRVMRVVFGMASLVGWLFHAVFWLLKQVLGFGLAR